MHGKLRVNLAYPIPRIVLLVDAVSFFVGNVNLNALTVSMKWYLCFVVANKSLSDLAALLVTAEMQSI